MKVLYLKFRLLNLGWMDFWWHWLKELKISYVSTYYICICTYTCICLNWCNCFHWYRHLKYILNIFTVWNLGLYPRTLGKNGNQLPNPRDISNKIFKSIPSSPKSGKFNVALTHFGQFVDHDVVATPIEIGKSNLRWTKRRFYEILDAEN